MAVRVDAPEKTTARPEPPLGVLPLASVDRSVGTRDGVVGALAGLAEAISPDASLEEMLAALAPRIRELFGVDRCSIFLREEVEGIFRGRVADVDAAVAGAARASDAAKRLVCGIPADRFTQEMLETRRPVWITNARTDPRPVRTTVIDWDLQSVLGIPMVAQDEVIGLIFLDDPGRRHHFEEEDEELAAVVADLLAAIVSQVSGSELLRETAARVARQNRLLLRSSSMRDRLTELALAGRGIVDMAFAVASVTGSPCMIYGKDLRRLAAASPPGFEGSTGSVLDEGTAGLAACSSALDGLAEGPKIVGPFPRRGENRRCLITLIETCDQPWGYLVMTETARRLSSVDISVAKQAASIIALELLAGQRGAIIDSETRDRLVHDVLEGTADLTDLRRRARQHGFDTDRRHVVVILERRGRDRATLGAREVEAALVSAGPSTNSAMTALADGRVGGLLELQADVPVLEASRGARDLLERAVTILAAGGEVAAAVSASCRLPEECAQGRHEAGRILRHLLTESASDGPAVLLGEDLGVARLVLGSGDDPDAQRFARGVLGPLLDGAPSAADLLHTLRVFMDCGRSVRHAAAHLGVHENTIRYRLARIAEVTGLDVLANPDHQLSCQLALMILQIHQDLVPAAPGSEA